MGWCLVLRPVPYCLHTYTTVITWSRRTCHGCNVSVRLVNLYCTFQWPYTGVKNKSDVVQSFCICPTQKDLDQTFCWALPNCSFHIHTVMLSSHLYWEFLSMLSLFVDAHLLWHMCTPKHSLRTRPLTLCDVIRTPYDVTERGGSGSYGYPQQSWNCLTQNDNDLSIHHLLLNF